MTDQFPPWWTEERLIELKARWAAGETSSEIGRALHNSRNAIIGKLHRLGLVRYTRPIKPSKPIKPANARRLRYVDNRYVFVGETVTEPLAPFAPPPGFQNPVSFAALASHHCRWPGEPGPQILFCGAPPANGYPYCLAHCRLAYVKPGAVPRPMP